MDEVNAQLNSLSQSRDVTYCNHYGGGWQISVTTGYRCVDRRKWYVPFSKTDCKPTINLGIALRLSEWFTFKQMVERLHRDYPDVNYTPCFLTHP